jgi:lysophospholipase L1-like esterase
MGDRRSVWWRIAMAGAIVSGGIIAAVLLVVVVLFYQGTRPPAGRAEYVALGSSFAAGAGLGDRASGAPFACGRGARSYPRLLAHALGLSLTDMSCSGATATQVLNGGQYFQGPQIAAVTARTRLVTLTVGGNDLYYVGDLLGLAKAKDGGFVGWAAPRVLRAPHAASARDLGALKANIRAIVRAVRAKAPGARIVIASYPAILPPRGTCPALRLTVNEADRMREVAARLVEATRVAASESGATLVDMAALGIAHSACAAVPWANGAVARPGDGDAFHPTRQGAAAIARQVMARLRYP